MDDFILARNKEIIEAAGIDALLVSNIEPGDRNFYAVTGADGHYIYSLAVVRPDGIPTLVVAGLEEDEAKGTGLPVMAYSQDRDAVIEKALGGARRVGINAGLLPCDLGDFLRRIGCEPINAGYALTWARAKKTPTELERIREAAYITACVAADIPGMVQADMTELDLLAEVDYAMRKRGADGFAFETLAAFGEGSAEPHHKSGSRQLREGDLVLVDFGARYHGLCADITRTYVCGEPADWQKALYETVLEAQDVALSMLRVGANSWEVHQAAEDHITRRLKELELGEGAKMGHSLGHSIGHFDHDGERLTRKWKGEPQSSDNSDLVIADGLVTTVEPGGYVPGRGGVRIEDDVYVTGKGTEIWTVDAPKERLIEVS